MKVRGRSGEDFENLILEFGEFLSVCKSLKNSPSY
jgi:hypothetical protein